MAIYWSVTMRIFKIYLVQSRVIKMLSGIINDTQISLIWPKQLEQFDKKLKRNCQTQHNKLNQNIQMSLRFNTGNNGWNTLLDQN